MPLLTDTWIRYLLYHLSSRDYYLARFGPDWCLSHNIRGGRWSEPIPERVLDVMVGRGLIVRDGAGLYQVTDAGQREAARARV